MVLVYERSRSIPYVRGVIFQFTSLKYGLGYRGVMASQIITLKSPTTGLFCFQKFVHDNPPKFRHNSLLRGESIGQRWFPSQRACGGSRARHSCAHGLVTSQHCGLRPGEPGDLRRLSLTTREARRAITSAAEVTTVECWSLRNTYRVSDLCLVVWAPRSSVHRESSVIYVRQAPW